MPLYKNSKKRQYGRIKMNFFTGATWIEYEPWEEEAMRNEREQKYHEFQKRISDSSWFKKMIEKIRKGK